MCWLTTVATAMVVVVVLAIVVGDAEGARVLMFVPTLSYSHVAFNAKLVDILMAEGHDVTLLLIDVDPTVKVVVSKAATVRRVNMGLEEGHFKQILWQNPGAYEDVSVLHPRMTAKLLKVSRIFVGACETLLANHTLLRELRAANFAVGLSEQYVTCGFGLFRLIGVHATFWLSATALYRPQPAAMGVDYPLSYVPELLSTFSTRMTFVERAINLAVAKSTECLSRLLVFRVETALAKSTRFFARRTLLNASRNSQNDAQIVDGSDAIGASNLLALASESNAIFVNNAPLLDFAAPTANFMRPLIGFTVDLKRDASENVALPEGWRRAIEWGVGDEGTPRRRRPFVLVTFGSIAKTSEMPRAMRDAIFAAFRHFPSVNFFVKYERQSPWQHADNSNAYNNSALGNGVSRVADNVFVASWIPQVQLIAHGQCVAMLTHSGWNSVLESVFHARPLILVPLFADQFKNARLIAHKELGVMISKRDALHVDTFVRAIHKVLGDHRYAQNSQRYAKMLRHFAVEFAPAELLIRHEMRRAIAYRTHQTGIVPPMETTLKNSLHKSNHSESIRILQIGKNETCKLAELADYQAQKMQISKCQSSVIDSRKIIQKIVIFLATNSTILYSSDKNIANLPLRTVDKKVDDLDAYRMRRALWRARQKPKIANFFTACLPNAIIFVILMLLLTK